LRGFAVISAFASRPSLWNGIRALAKELKINLNAAKRLHEPWRLPGLPWLLP